MSVYSGDFSPSRRRPRARPAPIEDTSSNTTDPPPPLSINTRTYSHTASDSFSIADPARLDDFLSDKQSEHPSETDSLVGSVPQSHTLITPLTPPNEPESASNLHQKVTALRRMFQAERSARSALEEELKSMRSQYRLLEKNYADKDSLCVSLFREKELLSEKLVQLQTERAAELGSRKRRL
ncbi:hypothetical protein GEMRC1_003417 [Eukaryota sp. GEM-RC1]